MSNKLAFLTPDSSQFSESQETRVICVPGSLWFLIGGALFLLAQEYNWEEFGTATAEETAEFFSEVIEEWAMSSAFYIGEIRAFVADTVPDKWLPFDGTIYDGADYPELFAVIQPYLEFPPGSGDFRLHDLTSYGLAGAGSVSGYNNPIGGRVGQLSIALTEGQLPAHSHEYIPPVFNVDLESPGAPDIQAAGVGAPTQTGQTGSGQPHSNLPPVFGVTWGIYAGR